MRRAVIGRTGAVFAMCVALLSCAASGDATGEGWEIGPRRLPIPAGASAELQAALAAAPRPDVAAERANIPPDEAAWREAIAGLDDARRSRIAELVERYGVTVEAGALGGTPVYRVTPPEVDPRHRDHVFFYLHGGAYAYFGGELSLGEAPVIAAHAKIPVIALDYRMPPDHPFPAAVEDAVAAYEALLKERPAGDIAIGGQSAGGGLSFAALQRIIDTGLEPPAAHYAATPWVDLTKTGDTQHLNEGVDRVLVTYDGNLGAAARLYAGEHALTHPLVSPIYGDFTGFPPTYLVTGTRDLFLSDTARAHRKLRAAGAEADLNVYEGLAHAEHFIELDTPESRDVYDGLAAFLLTHME
ncbi:MAG: alpha/beta hydrolase [Caulobacterales bacterium]|nr:alpha/beta hydrolase [Caulobacterales bacterium]